MKSIPLFVAGLLTVVAALTLASCHHTPSQERIGWTMEESSDRFSQEAAQSARLDAIAEEIMVLRNQMRADAESLHGSGMGEQRKSHEGGPVVDTLGANKRRQMDEMTDYLP